MHDVSLVPDAPVIQRPTVTCLSFRPLRRNTLVSFASLHWPRARLNLHNVAVHQNGKRSWCQLPARPQTGPDGNTIRDRDEKVQYAKVLEFFDRRCSDVFSVLAVEAVRAVAPDALDPQTPDQGGQP